MRITIKNWKLALLACIFIGLFTSLGFWQLSRADQKRALLQSYADRSQQTPLDAKDLSKNSDLQFYQAQLTGHFDNAHTFLLDNKILHSQVGYEIYTPFIVSGLNTPILIDRGFVPLGASRSQLPVIQPTTGNITITGLLNLPPRYYAYGTINESPQISWPLRVEFINTTALESFLGYRLFPYILTLSKNGTGSYTVEWQVVTMPPERHIGYAIQWFAFAITLLILFVALNRDKPKTKGK